MSNAQQDQTNRRAVDKMTDWVWLTATSRLSMIVLPFILAGIGAIAVEWRADFKEERALVRATALETAKVLERVTIRQEVLTKNDDRQDMQIERIWRRFRKESD